MLNFLNDEADSLKTKIIKASLLDYEPKLIDLISFSKKLLNFYNTYQQRDITYNEFKSKLLEKEITTGSIKNISLNDIPEISDQVKSFIDNVLSTMDAYKKNRVKYLDYIESNDELNILFLTYFDYFFYREMIDVIVQGVSFVLSGKSKPVMKLLGIKAKKKNFYFKLFF